MFSFPRRNLKQKIGLDLDETFLDSGNLPEFETEQFEGVMERPITRKSIMFLGAAFFLCVLVFLGKTYALQIADGEHYAELAKGNSLDHDVIFTERGVVYDRNGIELAWNDAGRTYLAKDGFGHVLGYVSYPTDRELATSLYHPKEFVGRDGIERYFNDILQGEMGLKIVEVNALGATTSESVLRESVDGENITISIDARIEEKLHEFIRNLARERGFQGGSGAIMDVRTGELIAVTNYPEYSARVLSQGEDVDTIARYQTDSRKPFLNRAFQGLYTPGSIFKLLIAVGVLNENIIDPSKVIHTTGKLEIPNPYDSTKSTIFPDWKNHGDVDMLDAIAVSSNVYFFTVGGGFQKQEGLGIARIEEYARMFGLGEKTGDFASSEESGLIPTPEWKENYFGEPWRLGDTYNTSIGQYNLQVTPIQMARAVAAIANGGTLLPPSLVLGGEGRGEKLSSVRDDVFETVRKGMREAVLRGTATGLSVPGVSVAAKTGTAEIDFSKTNVNSWVVGFFPYEKPRYAFVVVMEKGPRENFIGGVFVIRQLLDWMTVDTPEYLSETFN